VFWTTISRRELHMDRKAKATKAGQTLNLKEANGYKAEADISLHRNNQLAK